MDVTRRGATGLLLGAMIVHGPALASSSDDSVVAAAADAAWQRRLETDPMTRLQNGQVVRRLTSVSYAAAVRESEFARGQLARLAAVQPERLSADARVTLGVLRHDMETLADRPDRYWMALQVTNYGTLQVFNEVRAVFPSFAFKAPGDSETYLRLVRDYARLMRDLEDSARGQAERGFVLGRSGIDASVTLFRAQKANVGALLGVATPRLLALPAGEREAFAARLQALLDNEVHPALNSLIRYLDGPYRAEAPATVGLSQYAGGREHYRRLVRIHTSLDLDPEQIHRDGRKRHDDLLAAFDSLRTKLGHGGPRADFFDTVRRDTRFVARDPADIAARLRKHMAAAAPKLPLYFGTLPKAPYDVAPLPASAADALTFGYYSPPTDSRPLGLYYFNASQPEQRSLLMAAALTFHELAPGHHLQRALQQEASGLHPYRRVASNTAFGEGWGEYASSLGKEMGLYEDPWDELGRLAMEMLLANRLVVDTGMGYLGWSLEQARDYMRGRVFLSETEILNESLRYGSWPGQALAYGIGSQTIWDARRSAEAKLGRGFDIRRFHDLVLVTGAKPLSVLKDEVARWAAAGGPPVRGRP